MSLAPSNTVRGLDPCLFVTVHLIERCRSLPVVKDGAVVLKPYPPDVCPHARVSAWLGAQ